MTCWVSTVWTVNVNVITSILRLPVRARALKVICSVGQIGLPKWTFRSRLEFPSYEQMETFSTPWPWRLYPSLIPEVWWQSQKIHEQNPFSPLWSPKSILWTILHRRTLSPSQVESPRAHRRDYFQSAWVFLLLATFLLFPAKLRACHARPLEQARNPLFHFIQPLHMWKSRSRVNL